MSLDAYTGGSLEVVLWRSYRPEIASRCVDFEDEKGSDPIDG